MIGLTLSRSGFLALFILLIIFGLFRIGFIKVLMIITTLLIITVPLIIATSSELSTDTTVEKLLNSDSLNDRFRFYENSIEVFQRNPIFGSGSSSLINDDITIASGHLAYLTISAKFGLVGLLVYLIFWLTPVLYCLLNYQNIDPDFIKLPLLIYIPLLTAYFLYDYSFILEFQYIAFALCWAPMINGYAFRNPLILEHVDPTSSDTNAVPAIQKAI